MLINLFVFPLLMCLLLLELGEGLVKNSERLRKTYFSSPTVRNVTWISLGKEQSAGRVRCFLGAQGENPLPVPASGVCFP